MRSHFIASQYLLCSKCVKLNASISLFTSHLLLLICLLALPFQLNAQENFVYHYKMAAETDITLAKASNNDVIMAGSGGRYIFCARFNPLGQVIWRKKLKNVGKGELGDVTIGPNNGTVITYARGTKMTVMRLDGNGQPTFSKSFENQSGPFQELLPQSIWVNQADNYIIYGFSQVNNDGDQGVPFLMEITPGGQVQQTTKYPRSQPSGEARQTPDSGSLLVHGNTIVKTDPDGNVEWSKETNTAYNLVLNMEVLDNGDALILLATNNNNQFMVIRISKDGQLIWQTKELKYPGLGKVEVQGFTITPDTGVLVSGRVNTSGANPRNLPTLVKVSKQGEYEFMRYFQDNESPSPLYSGAFSLLGLADERVYFMAGKKSFDRSEPSETVFIKANSLDRDNDCISRLSYNEDPKPNFALSNQQMEANDNGWNDYSHEPSLSNLTLGQKQVCFACVDPEINLGPDTTICEQDTLLLRTYLRQSDHTWSNGQDTSAINVQEAGQYWVQVVNNCGEASDTITVSEHPSVDADITIQPETPNPLQEVTYQENNSAAKKEKWNFGDSNQAEGAEVSHQYEENGKYPVTLFYEDGNGCEYRKVDSLTVAFYSLYIPNAFTPNNDGKNELFAPIGFGLKNYTLKIFDRWGERLYEGNNEGWDGTSDGEQLPSGTYLYQIRIRNVYEDVIIRKGQFKLIR